MASFRKKALTAKLHMRTFSKRKEDCAMAKAKKKAAKKPAKKSAKKSKK
jgi:hypothetical protein